MSAAIGLTVAGVVLAPLALARIFSNTIRPVAIVSHDGRHVTLTGPLSCDQTQEAHVRVTVTQRSTGAVAEGHTSFIGTPSIQGWTVHATTLDSQTFEPGRATAVALGRTTTSPGHPDDAHQWLVNVELVEE